VTSRAFRKSESGAAVAEFAVASLFFFTLLIGIIEFGRLLYTHSALTDAARRGARYASLHSENAACVRKIVIYGEKHVDSKCDPTGPPLVNGLDANTVNINVTYAGADTDNDPDDETPIDTSYGTNLGTATVTIENFNFTLGIPLLNLTITMPNYRTTMSAESAGEEPADL
jgi:hypothetical protein